MSFRALNLSPQILKAVQEAGYTEPTPIQVAAARTALAQATARYKAGLTSIDDVAQAQRLLVQAEMDDSIARLNVWRAFLQLQSIRGDLQPFLQAAR